MSDEAPRPEAINRRRLDLIDRKYSVGLSPAEAAELASLQRRVLDAANERHPLPTRELARTEALVAQLEDETMKLSVYLRGSGCLVVDVTEEVAYGVVDAFRTKTYDMTTVQEFKQDGDDSKVYAAFRFHDTIAVAVEGVTLAKHRLPEAVPAHTHGHHAKG